MPTKEPISEGIQWHISPFPAPAPQKIAERLSQSLARLIKNQPNASAIIDQDRIYSFQDLGERAAGLAQEILEKGVKAGPIALVQSIGFDAVAAWFACSISGRAFLLLEPELPQSRLIELIELTQCAMILSDQVSSEALAKEANIALLNSNGGRRANLKEDLGLKWEEPTMIFPTSGSTGTPKLITYSAATIQVKVQSSIALMRVSQGARVLIAGSHANYGFLHHALVFLFAGGTLCLANIKERGFAAILEEINNKGVRHLRFTPSLFRKLAVLPQAKEALMHLDAVRFSGEPLLANDLNLAQAVLKPSCLIQNVYGSTESSLFIWSNTDATDLTEHSTVPIGHIYPLSAYALLSVEAEAEAENNKSQIGELILRSQYHALGDYQGGKIEEERFPKVDAQSAEKIYHSGDMVRQLPDGSLVHLGRLGRMVKIRGQRVALSEVENQLRSMPGVTAAAVVDRIERDNVVLYAFISSNDPNLQYQHAQSWLANRLPHFMLPRKVQLVAHIPLLPGGKVNYKQLLSEIENEIEHSELSHFQNKNLAQLAQLWDSVLWPGAHKYPSDFLALGGDSLSLMVLAVEVERFFGRKLPLEQFRANSSFMQLAELLEIEKLEPEVPSGKDLGPKLSQLWPAPNDSGAVVLAMPGVGGWAPVHSIIHSGFFGDYELWIADLPHRQGSLLKSAQWYPVAKEIADNIRNGAIPKPKVLFGFSFGGGLAWMVSRLLAGSSFCPEYLVMVDAPSLHRIKKYRHPDFSKQLKSVASIAPPPSLHIRRAALPGDLGRDKYSWAPEDNITDTIELPTIHHSEMARWDMLALASDAVASFLNQQRTPRSAYSSRSLPSLPGVQIYLAIRDKKPKELEAFIDSTDILDYESISYLIAYFLSFNQKTSAKRLLNFALGKWPTSGLFHFLNYRTSRTDSQLLYDGVSLFPASSFARYEKLLSSHKSTLERSYSRLYRHYWYSRDLAFALLDSKILARRARAKLFSPKY